jgi:hypothetical protein
MRLTIAAFENLSILIEDVKLHKQVFSSDYRRAYATHKYMELW